MGRDIIAEERKLVRIEGMIGGRQLGNEVVDRFGSGNGRDRHRGSEMVKRDEKGKWLHRAGRAVPDA